MKQDLALVILLFFAIPIHAETQDRFISKSTLPNGLTVVVAEGDYEARSIGSFSVRLYEAAADPDETTFFISGLIRARDGVVERVISTDINGDEQQEVVVVVRSVGTGNYQSVYAFAIASDEVTFCTAVEGLAPDIDIVAALRKTEKRRQ